MTKISKIGFFLFITIYNYVWMRMIMFRYFYNEYGNMGIYYTGILAVCLLLIFLFIPKKLLCKDYEESFKKSNFKYFYSALLLIENIFALSYCIYLLSEIFIPTGNFYIMLALVVGTVVALSYYKPKDVMEISTLFLIVGYIILFSTLLFYPNSDMSLLLPIRKTNALALPFFLLMILGNNFSLVIHKKGVPFSKTSFMLAIFVALVFFGIEYFILLTNAGAIYFKNLHWVGFIILSIEQVSKYIGNFDFAHIFYILVCCIFKYSYNLSLIRNNIAIPQKAMTVFLSLLIFISGVICYTCIPMEQLCFKVIGAIMILSSVILFWFLKECYYVRKVKE